MFFHFFILTYRHCVMGVHPSCHKYIIHIQWILTLRASDTVKLWSSEHPWLRPMVFILSEILLQLKQY